jgi:competence protein ComEC
VSGPAIASVALAWLIPQFPMAINPLAAGAGVGLLWLAGWLLGGWRVALVCLTLAGAMLRGNWALENRLDPATSGKDVLITGAVCDFPKRDSAVVRFLLETTGDGSQSRDLPARIYLSWFGAESVPNPGDRWQLKVRLKAPRGLRNPGAFDYEAWAFAHAIGATGYVRPSLLNRRSGENVHDCRVAEWRAKVAQLIERSLPEHPAMPYVLGLVVAATYALKPEDWDLMRQTGTTHLLAISGLNIVMVTAPILLLGRGAQRLVPRLGLWVPAGIGMGPAIAVAAIYTALAGFGVSTVRALIMTMVAACYVFAARAVRGVDLLMIAALAVALLDPVSLRSASFWLSFVAVGWLLLAITNEKRTTPALAAPRGWVNWIIAEGKALIVLQLVLGLGLAPILLFWFDQISLVSPIVNLLAVPIFSLWILPLCLIATAALACAPQLGGPLMLVAADSLQFLLDGLKNLAALPGVVWQAPPAGAEALLLAAIGAVGVCWPRPAPCRALAALCMFPVVFGVPGDVPERLRVVVLDVGQGLAVLVQTRRHVMVYDTGPAYRSGDAGTSVVLPVLRRIGVRALDVLVISHADMDHRGGAQSVAGGFPDAGLIATARWNLPLEHYVECGSGLDWEWDGVRFEAVSPLPADGRHWSGNDDSCVLVISTQGARIVLPGDIERLRERELVDRKGSMRVDLLIAPHHGSRSSSSDEFVSALRSRYVVFSTGFHNRWHFPSAAVDARWRASGSCTLNTADTGALTFELQSNRLTLVAAERIDSKRAWTGSTATMKLCDGMRVTR